MKRRSTFTTTVLAFLSLTTTPCNTRFGISFFLPSTRLQAAFGQNRFDTSKFFADFAHAIGLFELTVRTLKTQVELLLLQLHMPVGKFVRRFGANVFGRVRFLRHRYTPSRAMNFVATESLAAPRRIASFAVSTSTPSISNRMRPGFTLATQYSGAPLPEPMRTSAGFFDTGTSGNTRIHTRPARFIWRVIARRAASISRAVMRSGSRAFRP